MGSEDSTLTAAEEAAVRSCVLRQLRSLQVDSLEVSPAVGKGENIMSVVTKVVVLGHDTLTGNPFKNVLVLKRILQSEERRLMFHCDAAFANEAAFYSRVLPTMMQQCSAKLAFPPCLHAADDLIILRHLGEDGYVMADRRQGLDLQHCQLVLKELGKYNAVSYAMKHNSPEVFKRISDVPREVFITKDFEMFDAYLDQNITMALKAISGLDSSIESRLNAIIGNGLKRLIPLVTSSEPMAVICHGDFWNNNLLFRYSSADPRTPSDVCFLDLQGCRYASPALDILYFLFSSSRPGVVRQHFRQLIDSYHCSLVDHLKLFAPTAPTFTFTDIMEEIKAHSLFGLAMSLMVMPSITQGDLNIDIDAVTKDRFMSEEFQEEVQREFITPEYKKRVTEVISLCLDYGFI